MIAIVDYQAGNLASVKKALDHVGAESCITRDPEVVRRSERIVLPGVGHFSATQVLQSSGLSQAIQEAIAREVPVLGICVGMQWMFEGSEEAPEMRSLGLIAGRCGRFAAEMKSPHVGWNNIRRLRDSVLLRGVADETFVYYTHSFRAPCGEATVATTEYGGEFASVVESGRTFGVQFHPEKSSRAGLQLLANFCEVPC